MIKEILRRVIIRRCPRSFSAMETSANDVPPHKYLGIYGDRLKGEYLPFLFIVINPLSPGIKLQILLLRFHTFLTEGSGETLKYQ